MSIKKIPITANPSKEFFIKMLTKDIALVDCVLDLIDNSIDSIISKTKFDPMKGLFKREKISLKDYKISIRFNKDEFNITDNAEGVSVEDAEERVFKFGAENEKEKGAGLSVYGIGMKRSFLKIGNSIQFNTVNSKNIVEVNIDVPKWLDKEGWDFAGEVSNKRVAQKTGTSINVKKLNKQVSVNFDNLSFETKLLKKIGQAYGIFLMNDLGIEVNGIKAQPILPKIAKTESLNPAIKSLKPISGVKVKIIAGLTHEDSKAMNGWYIFCNGRLILSGDTTPTTGWGDDNLKLRQFHPSLNRFVGFVYFESDNVSMLPWTTTKDNVHYDSPVYQYALNEMVQVARPISDYLAKLYRVDSQMTELREQFKVTDEISIENLKTKDQDFSGPKIDNKTKKKKEERILYTVTSSELKKIKELLGKKNISNEKIGKTTFDYYLKYES